MLLLLCMLLAAEPPDEPVVFTPQEQRRILQHSPVPTIPDDPTNAWDHDPRAVRLGQAFFFDAGFSGDGNVSCASCHGPMIAFTDGLPRSVRPTVPEADPFIIGERHAPSLLNAAHQRWFFWDGRADTLWAQALHPIENPKELDSSRIEFVRRVHDEPLYRTAYERVFGPLPAMDDHARFPIGAAVDTPAWTAMDESDRDAVTLAFVNCAKAIAAYETQLRSAGAPFDTFAEGLRTGDPDQLAALSPSQQRGLRLFVGDAGCRQCHSGPLFTDFEFHNIGIPPGEGAPPNDSGRHQGIRDVQRSPFSAHGPYSDEPNGRRARLTRSALQSGEHWGAFKTPSLRNVTLTPPYMHHGQFESLEDVLTYYNTLDDMVIQDHHQETVLQPLELDEDQLNDLAAFLRSLESPLPDRSLMGVPTSPLLEVEPTAAD
jgi:cytochrome c peroxidase